MKKNSLKYLFQVLLFISVCIYAFAEWKFNSLKTEDNIECIQKHINHVFNEEEILLNEIETPKNTVFPSFENYYYGIYKNDSLIKWNNPDFIITENISSIKDGRSVQHLSNGYYVVFKKSVSDMVYAVFKPIYTRYNVTNNFLKNESMIRREIVVPF